MLIHGTSPPQYSGCRRLGVWPDSIRATSTNALHFQPAGAFLFGIPTAIARIGAICLVVATRPPVLVFFGRDFFTFVS